MKKSWSIAFLLVLAVFLAGCSDSSSTEENENASEGDVKTVGSEDAEVELSFWLFGADYESLVEEYVEENPNVSIDIQQISMADHHNNLFTALSAGSGAPDMAAIEVSEIDKYKGAQDKFYNLNEFGAEDIQDNYLDWVWEIGSSVDGEFQFGIPTDIGPTAMFYRKDVFEEAGLPSKPEEVNELIQTWDDYEKVASTVLEETGKVMVDNPETVFNAKKDQAPEQYFNKDGELIIDSSPYIKDAFMNVSGMMQEDYIGNYELWSPEWGEGMSNGSFATLPGPAWMRDTIKNNAPDAENWRIASMPEGAGNWGGSWMTIPKQSEHPEEAYKFLKWLLAPEQQLKSFKNNGMFPSTPEVYEKEEFKNITDDYYGGQNVAQIFADAALEVEHVHKGEQYGDANMEVVQGLYNVYDGSDPEQEWEDIVSRIERRLSR
ncbi:carbohydrate ABC transporter substrate-binding protein [Halobacillus halophilus]|uniref:ABC-type transport system extracellular binding protein (Probable substrate sugar/cellobiose) n=1 Tax=Halobacillus halophilus (strain ATCC 35676 / DSM 2266 / JCM 20832 / KCTC 3685 / LMG 17431 / NBRC 102448 / NCIMB 2269) TaxID=866895 RepID=I0JRG1_HALH3|nr:ABC transporter substrate-binding protein [Halobacillus halophilus]ASF40705.1 carbohydrate ABC transporter substrate-binding protein [Halobacillus halophilus]CCG46731.1 ABC-type transport system extracellular binding protein (probable substrate sugar/cellobiose) [Halobacillus halophilus DSM 2266]